MFPFGSSSGSHILECDLVVGKIDMLDLGGHSPSLAGTFTFVLLSFMLDSADLFDFEPRICIGRFLFDDEAAFQLSETSL